MADIYWPFDPSIINYGFGYPPGYGGFHNGIDFPVPQGTTLLATASGIARNVDAGATDGWGVDITTDDGWKVRMWHTSEFLVPNGSRVNAGDVLARSGGTPGTPGAGNATGPHLHWGIMVGGNWVDPASLNPQNFNQPKPKPEDEDMAQGAFYRIKDGDTGGGSIYWQEKPNTVLIPVSLATWIAYSTNGNKYADLSAKDVNALITKYGSAPTPPAVPSGGSSTVTLPDYTITMTGSAVKK